MTELAVGTVLPALAVGPIDRTTLALFAGASGDHNPMHIDIDVARASGAEDVFAHGMLSAAYVGRLLTGWVAQDRIRSLSMRFLAITPVSAAPTCSGEVVGAETVDGETRATIALRVTLPDGTTTLTGSASVATSKP